MILDFIKLHVSEREVVTVKCNTPCFFAQMGAGWFQKKLSGVIQPSYHRDDHVDPKRSQAPKLGTFDRYSACRNSKFPCAAVPKACMCQEFQRFDLV